MYIYFLSLPHYIVPSDAPAQAIPFMKDVMSIMV